MNWYKIIAYCGAMGFLFLILAYFITQSNACIIPFENIFIVRLLESIWIVYSCGYFIHDILTKELKIK